MNGGPHEVQDATVCESRTSSRLVRTPVPRCVADGLSADSCPVGTSATTSRKLRGPSLHPSWEDPVAVLLAVGGVAVAVAIVATGQRRTDSARVVNAAEPSRLLRPRPPRFGDLNVCAVRELVGGRMDCLE